MTTNGTSRLFYLDTSALAKVLVPEQETEALLVLLAGGVQLASSALTVAELGRVALRRGPETEAATREVLGGVYLTAVSRSVLDKAAGIGPPALRALDAIHVASAMELGEELTALITYDRRMREAAEANGITVIAPGAD